jgi:hypothetical protein
MQSILFKVTEEEIKSLSSTKLTKSQVKDILSAIENDPVLWDEIEKSIEAAIDFILKK